MRGWHKVQSEFKHIISLFPENDENVCLNKILKYSFLNVLLQITNCFLENSEAILSNNFYESLYLQLLRWCEALRQRKQTILSFSKK